MIKNDFRYIIKKIIIGIGIILGISFIRSCNVYALEDTSNMLFLGGTTTFNDSKFYLDEENQRIYVKRVQNGSTYEGFYDIPDDYKYLTVSSLSGSNINTYVNGVTLTTSELVYSNNNNTHSVYCKEQCNYITIAQETSRTSNKAFITQTGTRDSNTVLKQSRYFMWNNYDVYDKDNNTIYAQKNLDYNIGIQIPEIISLNPTFNENEDVLLSVTFSPEFSFIDTNNYNYYAWFKGYDKLSILENNTVFNTQYNTTFYVEITDKQGNTIDAETFTVSRIGQYDVSEYQILFSYDSYTESDTINESKPVDYINRVDIDTTFLPKSPYLKYQYQFVNEGDSLTDDWITINPENSSDLSKNNFIFTTHDNGTLYARIVDLDGNYLYSSTYTITNIGSVKYYANDTNVGGFFDKIINKLDYSGPISSLISVPIRLFSSLLSESSKTCTPYNFGILLGSQITFSCVNIENYIGSNLYHLIDLLMSFGLALGIIHFIKKQYHKFTTLNENSDDIM